MFFFFFFFFLITFHIIREDDRSQIVFGGRFGQASYSVNKDN